MNYSIVAVSYGYILIISSTSCFSIVFTALLSPFLLKEKFNWKIDGVTILLIGIGSTMSVTQRPVDNEVLSKDNLILEQFNKFRHPSAIIYLSLLFVLYMIRNCLSVKVINLLNEFYANSIENYHNIQNKNKESKMVNFLSDH